MGFFKYVLLGAVAYASGWVVRLYVLNKKDQSNQIYGTKHPLVKTYLGVFFVIMLLVSALIGRYLLGHDGVDMAFILTNSLVATFVFSFGLVKDQVKHDVPD